MFYSWSETELKLSNRLGGVKGEIHLSDVWWNKSCKFKIKQLIKVDLLLQENTQALK